MACDLCGAKGTPLNDLRDQFATDDIRAVCPKCERVINQHLSKIDNKIAEPARAAPAFIDSTPEMHVGGSAFESWYSDYLLNAPVHQPMKQRARDAYAAGMGDPLVVTAPAAVAGPSKAVAYLDIGSGGYLDLGTDLNYEDLFKLPSGRHMLAIVGTFGADGYTPAAAPTTHQAAPAAVTGPSYPSITLDFKQATELLEMFGGEPGLVTLQMGREKSHSGTGLYAYYSELPEEGAEFLGAEPDDEAVPTTQAAPVAQGDAEVLLISAVDEWFAKNTGLGGCSDEDVRELRAIFAAHPAAPVAQGDALNEVRRAVAAIAVVGHVDGNAVVRRRSVLDMLDRRIAARAQAKEGGAA